MPALFAKVPKDHCQPTVPVFNWKVTKPMIFTLAYSITEQTEGGSSPTEVAIVWEIGILTVDAKRSHGMPEVARVHRGEWQGVAIELYFKIFGRRCVCCSGLVKPEEAMLYRLAGPEAELLLVHEGCKP